MTARTRKWAVLSALCLLSLDLALVAVAAPRARGWLESARGSALVRAGTIALRDLGAPGERGLEKLSATLLTRFTHRSTNVYAIILRATPREAARAAAVQARREARCVMIEKRVVCTMATDGASDCPLSSCPTAGCASSGLPKGSEPEGPASRSSATGLPISVLGVTME
jgi:hypothetical protein